MNILRFQRYDRIVSLACVAFLAYFAWHALYGPRGYAFRDQLQTRLAALDLQLAEIDGTRQAIEAKVRLMRPESVDKDMLEELARNELLLVGQNELVVKLPH